MRFLLSVAVKIVSSWIQQIAVHAGGWLCCQRRILMAHCPGVRVSKRPSSCLTTLSSLLVPICQWTRFLDISYKQFLQSHDPGPKKHSQLSTSSHQKIIHSRFITPWWCESVAILFVCPVSLIRAKTGDNWWFGTKIVIYHFLPAHNWGAETDAESKYWRVHLLLLPVNLKSSIASEL